MEISITVGLLRKLQQDLTVTMEKENTLEPAVVSCPNFFEVYQAYFKCVIDGGEREDSGASQSRCVWVVCRGKGRWDYSGVIKFQGLLKLLPGSAMTVPKGCRSS